MTYNQLVTKTEVSIVVPSYRRPDRLERCLRALAGQSRAADEILVVCRADDQGTWTVAGHTPNVRRVGVGVGGVLAAMRAGARAAHGRHIGFVDDDAEPHRDWLEGALKHLSDPSVGAVGGRDIVDPQPDHRPTTNVGRLTSNGKVIGNHHLGAGPPRDVQVLKAANMVFRRSALALPDGLRGPGAQVHFEVATCLWAIGQGWRLVYDPSLVVDHLAGPRFDEDGRNRTSAAATANAAYNLMLCVGAMRPEMRIRRLLYGTLIGDRGVPGIARAAVAAIRKDMPIAARLLPSLQGQLAAALALRRTKHPLELYTYPRPGEEVSWLTHSPCTH